MADDLTVEQARAELLGMFPDRWFEITISQNEADGKFRFWYWINCWGKPRQGQGAATLTEAMQQVRDWYKELNQ